MTADIEPAELTAWAKEHLDIELTPWQAEVAGRLARGETAVSGRSWGRRTALRVAAAYAEQEARA